MAGGIEGHAGNESHRDLVVGCEEFAGGFHDMESALAEVGGRGVAAQLHRGGAGNAGQKDSGALGHKAVEQGTDIYLVGQGPVG